MKIYIITDFKTNPLLLKKLISFVTERGHKLINLNHLINNDLKKNTDIYETSLQLLKSAEIVLGLPGSLNFDFGYLLNYALFHKRKCIIFETENFKSNCSIYLGCTAPQFYRKKIKNDNDMFKILTLFKI